MIVAVFLSLAFLGITQSQTALKLPHPVVDWSSFNKANKPWAPTCCMIPGLIRSHLVYNGPSINLVYRVNINPEYFCEELSTTITQLLYTQNRLHDCRAISDIIVKLVARKILQSRARTVTTAFNTALLATYRQFTKNLVEGSSSSSVYSVLQNILSTRGVPSAEISYIQRRVSYYINGVYSSQVVSFLERVELSRTMTQLLSLHQQLMTIINSTHLNVNSALSQIKAAIKLSLHGQAMQAMESYHLRAYYLAFFKALLASANGQSAISSAHFVLRYVHNAALSSAQISSIISAVTQAIGGTKHWISHFVYALNTRNKQLMLQRFSGSSNLAYASTLIDKLGWVNLHLIPGPRNLLREYKDLLAELRNYQTMLSGFSQNLGNRPFNEQQYHQSSLLFLRSLIANIHKELADNKWIHTYNPRNI